MTITIATTRTDFVAQLNATVKATDILSASVLAAVRNVIEQNGNPQSIGFILSGLEEANYKIRSPKNFNVVVNFINAYVGCVKVKDDDGEPKLTEQGDYVLKKSEKRLSKIFENHGIEGFKDGMSGRDLAPLMEQLGTKLDEYMATREIHDEMDDDEQPSIFAATKDSRTEEQKEEEKKEKAKERETKARKQWADGGKEKHAQKAADMGESFLGYIDAVCKAFGKSRNELIELIAEVESK